MSLPASFLRRQSLRVRITLAFVVTGVVLAGILGIATFLGARAALERQAITAATDQTIVVLKIARGFFEQKPQGRPGELVAQLQTRGEFEALVVAREDFFRTALGLSPDAVPADLKAVVDRERLAYRFTELPVAEEDGSRFLIFGAPLPPQQTELFLFYPLASVDRSISVLLRSLLLAGLAVVAVAAIVAQRVSGRILRPVHEVSTAAQRVAEGLLETRVTPATADEVGVLAASFNQMASAFQEMITRERSFVANVSHELRTPLATLRTASGLLESHRDEFSPSAREAVDLLAEDVVNLQRLIEELMEVSEVDAGRAVIRWEKIELLTLADAVATKMRREVAVEGDPVITVSDKARLERILANLIDNAYSHGGGRDVRVAVARQNGSCEVAVSDRGPGIEPADLPRLFDRFYKADSSRTRERGGIGLGLAIAYENARLLGGNLSATSDRGAGTTFLLRIPQREAPPEEAS